MRPSARLALIVLGGLCSVAVPGGITPPGTHPIEVGAGRLLASGPDGLRALPVLGIDVQLDVSGILVHGTVLQRFRNPGPGTLEALYAFPLPEAAAVHRMEVRIGERRIRSVIHEKEKARQVYEQARDEGRKAALTEQQRPNLFTLAVANINAGEIVEVRLEYLQELELVDGRFGLTFPLTLVPRFDAGAPPASLPAAPDPGSPAGLRAAPPVARVIARVQPGFDLEGGDVFSPSHDVATRWDGDALVVETRQPGIPADRDYRLEWRPLPGLEPRSTALVEEREDGRYVLLMVIPPVDREGDGLPTETLFILDVSSSMAGASIARAREALDSALGRLRPDDRFNILIFATEVQPYGETFLPAGDREVEAARAWVRSLETAGGTRIDRALRRGFEMAAAPAPRGLRRIVFLTDGGVNNEEEVLRIVREGVGDVRLHALGIGAAPNRWLLREMGRLGRGSCRFIAEPGTVDNEIASFLARVGRPVLTDLLLAGGDATFYPDPLPDLHAGEPLFASLRLPPDAPLGEIRLSGRTADGAFEQVVEVAPLAASTPGVAQRWARSRVSSLLDSLHLGGDPDLVRDAVVRTSLEFGIVTRYTSLVAVEEFPTAVEPAARVRVPSALPGGMLPRGGTGAAFWLRVAVLLLMSGSFLWAAGRRT